MQPGEHLGLEFDGPDASSTTLDPDGITGSSGAKEPSESKVPPYMSKNRMTSLHLLRDQQTRAWLTETPTTSPVK